MLKSLSFLPILIGAQVMPILNVSYQPDIVTFNQVHMDISPYRYLYLDSVNKFGYIITPECEIICDVIYNVGLNSFSFNNLTIDFQNMNIDALVYNGVDDAYIQNIVPSYKGFHTNLDGLSFRDIKLNYNFDNTKFICTNSISIVFDDFHEEELVSYDYSLSNIRVSNNASVSLSMVSINDDSLNAYRSTIQNIINSYSGGYQEGYSIGYNDASLDGGTATEIFTGILNVGLLPVNFFLAIFNFEIFGVNLASIVAALISVAITIIVIKVCTGKGGGSDD